MTPEQRCRTYVWFHPGAMAQSSGAAALALQLHAVVLFLSCVGALGLKRADQSINTSTSKAAIQDYREYFAGVVIFGDSTVDVGVNNYLITAVKSNFAPYGRIFQGGQPTGRFCDGKLFVDFLAEKIGYPYPLPYLAPNAHGQAILTGVNFASAASGWYDLTAANFNVKSLREQLEWYKQWQKEVISLVGQERGEFIIENTLCIVSTGANDYINNYYLFQVLRTRFTPEEYTTFLLGKARAYIQELYDLGGRKIAILGLPPLGCLPSQITLHGILTSSCVEEFNTLALNFNKQLIEIINNELKPNFHGGRLVYLDLYTPLDSILKNPQAYGISDTRTGCCGTGLIETIILCNKLSVGTCKLQDAKQYLWWDSFHPIEHVNSFLAEDLFDQAAPTLLGPAQP